jgi:hypothetical protein
MPAVSLVICVRKQRDLLVRLFSKTAGHFDDLVVVHDGPEDGALHGNDAVTTKQSPAIDYSKLSKNELVPGYTIPLCPPTPNSIHELVLNHGGKYFVGPRSFQQEPHWPFAWAQAKHDWIMRLDADEFPSIELKKWLQDFRSLPEPEAMVSGYMCIWPLWNGTRATTKCWPANRIFLFHKQRVRYFGIAEQVPIADDHFEALPLILHHRPRRKSYGLRNILLRRQAYHWCRLIAQSLLGKPTDLATWRWTDTAWPPIWQEIRDRPLRTAAKRLFIWSARTAVQTRRAEGRIDFSFALTGSTFNCLFSLTYWRAKHTRPRT